MCYTFFLSAGLPAFIRKCRYYHTGVVYILLTMLKEKPNEKGFVSILETLIASIIVVISITAAGFIINSGLKISSQAQNTAYASSLAEQTFLKASALPYRQLATVSAGLGNNVIDLQNNKTDGCSPINSIFSGETVIVSNNGIGLPYCEVKTRNNLGGIEFNIQTYVTEYPQTAENNKNNVSFTATTFLEAKIVHVQISWFEGDLDGNNIPILKTLKAEKIFVPTISECFPTEEGVTCLN